MEHDDKDAKRTQIMAHHARMLKGRGFECEDGWLDLIDELCTQLQHATDHLGAPQIEVRQIKEKFGELRFYVAFADDHQHALIDEACTASASICETCGQPGSLWVSGRYFHTACERHKRPGSIDMPTYLRLQEARKQSSDSGR